MTTGDPISGVFAALAGLALFRRNLVAAMLLHLLINLPILIPTVLHS